MPPQNDFNAMYNDDTASSILSLLTNRLLQDDEGNATSVPTNDGNDNSTFDAPTEAPTSPPIPTNDGSTGSNSLLNYNPSFGMLVLLLVLALLLVLCWNWCRYLKIRREQYQLQITSARADTVLGDMQVRYRSVDLDFSLMVQGL